MIFEKLILNFCNLFLFANIISDNYDIISDNYIVIDYIGNKKIYPSDKY